MVAQQKRHTIMPKITLSQSQPREVSPIYSVRKEEKNSKKEVNNQHYLFFVI
jgi:hypothetical protein